MLRHKSRGNASVNNVHATQCPKCPPFVDSPSIGCIVVKEDWLHIPSTALHSKSSIVLAAAGLGQSQWPVLSSVKSIH